MNNRAKIIALISSAVILSAIMVFAAVWNPEQAAENIANKTKYEAGHTYTTEGMVTLEPFKGENAKKDAPLPKKNGNNKGTPAPAKPASNQDIDKKNFTLKGIDGKSYTLTNYRDKLVFVNFWTTWCIYCEQEMPDLIAANKRLTSSGKGIVLAVDVNESESKVKSFVNSKGWSGIPFLLDTNGAVSKKFNVTGFPSTFVFYKGKLIKSWGFKIDSRQINALINDVEAGKYG